VGGPPTTLPKPGSPPSPPPDPTAILSAVQADLAQLTAIQAYGQARAAVANSQQGVDTADSALHAAVATQSAARTAVSAAASQVSQSVDRLRHLALAAYMGLGYVTPAAGPVGDQPAGNGTVSSPGGLTGSAALDARELLQLVAVRDRTRLSDTRRTLEQAQAANGTAGQGVIRAQTAAAGARMTLTARQQTLRLLTRAAVTPGLASTLNLVQPPADQAAAGAGAGGAGEAVETASPSPSASPTILGPSTLSGPEMAGWFASTKRTANVTVALPQVTADYQSAGQQTGVRADLAFAQSVVETGYFSFPAGGQLTAKDNNFAGIGACDSCAHGWTFPNAQTGVSAQLELLEAYASPTPVPTPLVGSVGVGGCCPTWMALAGKWASSLVYGISIMTVYDGMLSWVIPQRLQAAGLGPAGASGSMTSTQPDSSIPATPPATPGTALP
jgi:hypothetical protein